MTLRSYQERAIGSLRHQYHRGHRAPCLVLPTGAGKTIVAAAIIRSALERGLRVLFLAHRQELINQSRNKLEQAGILGVRVIQAATDTGTQASKVAVASIPTLVRWGERMPLADFVIFDECFPAGTRVDDRPIESLRVGDLVRSYNHQTNTIEMRHVRRLFCSRPTTLVTVHLSDGRAITCTAGHPFFDGVGYTPAAQLQAGDNIYGSHESDAPMRRVFDGIPRTKGHRNADLLGGVSTHATRCTTEKDNDAVRGVRGCRDVRWQGSVSGGARSTVLLDGLQFGLQDTRQFDHDGCDESQVCIEAHEGTKPDAACRYTTEGERQTARDRASAADSRWQWSRSRSDGNATAECAAFGMAAEPTGSYRAARERLPNGVQAGSRESRDENRNRGGRRQPLNAQGQSGGRAETDVSRVARVDRVEIHERRGSDGFGALCPDDLVYNIEVEGNHNYFVDGVLVHNCHHVKARTWAGIADHYRSARLLGLTATPQRADGKALGDIFDSIVVGATVRELTELGHLVPCRTFAPSSVLDSRQTAMSPVAAYRQYADGTRAVVFCTTVEHATAAAQEFVDAGITAAVVHGGLSKQVRDQRLKALADGALQVVTSVHVLTEGWDSPSVQTCILLRKPQHDGLFLQMVGRVLRPAPGKTHATLIDLCGSVLDHGTVDAERTYALDGAGITRETERDPIRQCSSCGGVCRVGPAACPLCGELWPARPAPSIRIVNTPVTEITGPIAPRTSSWTTAMPAKFPGQCSICTARIAVGQRILWAKGERPRHEACAIGNRLADADRLLGAG